MATSELLTRIDQSASSEVSVTLQNSSPDSNSVIKGSTRLKPGSLLGSTYVVNCFWRNVLRLRSHLSVISVSRRSVAIVLGHWSDGCCTLYGVIT